MGEILIFITPSERDKGIVVIVCFAVVCLVAKPLNRNEAKGDLVMIQTLLLFKCKLLCYLANWILMSKHVLFILS